MAHLWRENMRKMNWVRAWLVLWVGLFLYGCATTEDVRILDGEIRRIHSQLNTIQKEKDLIKNELATFQKENQKDISTLQTETKRLQADLLIRLENLQSEIRILTTGVEEYKEFLKRPSKEIDQIREDIAMRTRLLDERGKTFEEKNRAQDERTRALEERTKGTEDRLRGIEDRLRGFEDRLKGLDGKISEWVSKQAEMEKPTPGKEVSVEMKGISPGVGTLYKDAYEIFQKGDLEGARKKFEAFLKQYPNTELSDNAQFWIGEIYYLKKDFERAILEYEKAIAKYPEGDKIPAALFKQALAFLELGDKTNARNLLRRLIERYPQSDQTEMAKKKLEAIK
jgi:tol-pal system protein YbgF